MSKDTGGSAFPHPQVNLDDAGLIFLPNSSGMTMRDWFAGLALAECLKEAERVYLNDDDSNKVDVYEFAACRAYMIADAMIKERNL